MLCCASSSCDARDHRRLAAHRSRTSFRLKTRIPGSTADPPRRSQKHSHPTDKCTHTAYLQCRKKGNVLVVVVHIGKKPAKLCVEALVNCEHAELQNQGRRPPLSAQVGNGQGQTYKPRLAARRTQSRSPAEHAARRRAPVLRQELAGGSWLPTFGRSASSAGLAACVCSVYWTYRSTTMDSGARLFRPSPKPQMPLFHR